MGSNSKYILRIGITVVNFKKTIEESAFRTYEPAKVLLFMEGRKPVDIRLYRKDEKVIENLAEAKEKGLNVLMLPNPVRVSTEAWKGYTEKRKRGESAIDVAVKYRLLREENIAELRIAVLDLDDPYEEVRKLWDKFTEVFGIEGYTLERSKSGRFKAYLTLKPYLTPKGIAWYKPHEKHNNKHTHLENLRELYGIWISWWQKQGISIDTSFFYNLNHPVWFPEIEVDGKVSKIEEVKEGYAGSLYNLYRKAKQVQAEQGLWSFKAGNRKINLTVYFWEDKLPYTLREYRRKKEEENRLKVPEFIKALIGKEREKKQEERKAEELIKELYRRAVLNLASKHESYRFIHVMLPSVGWARFLGFEESFVYGVLKDALPDKNNFDKDFRIAWERAWELEFSVPKGLKKKRNIGKLIEKLERTKLRYWIERTKDFIKRKGEVFRQDLLKKIFHGQKWLCDLVLSVLEKEGLVIFRFTRGKVGRPSKLVCWIGEAWKTRVSEFSHKYNNCLACSGVGEQPTVEKKNGELLKSRFFIQKTFDFALKEKLILIRKIYEVYLSVIGKKEPFTLNELRKELKIKVSKFKLSLILKALHLSNLIKKKSKGKRGIEVEGVKVNVLDEFISRLLKAEIIYLNELNERLKFIEWLRDKEYNDVKFVNRAKGSKRKCNVNVCKKEQEEWEEHEGEIINSLPDGFNFDKEVKAIRDILSEILAYSAFVDLGSVKIYDLQNAKEIARNPTLKSMLLEFFIAREQGDVCGWESLIDEVRRGEKPFYQALKEFQELKDIDF